MWLVSPHFSITRSFLSGSSQSNTTSPVVTMARLQAFLNHWRISSSGGIFVCHSFQGTAGTLVPAWQGMGTRPFSAAARALSKFVSGEVSISVGDSGLHVRQGHGLLQFV